MPLLVDFLNEKAMIPDIIRRAPQLRLVLDRYGLRGCGGPLGPVESLGFFARAHDVPIDRLLAELRQQLQESNSAPKFVPSARSSPTDHIYRPFFKAGIAVALTLGAAWGAYLLLQIAFSDSLAAASVHEINAHGHAQIFGWVGLFVMGFAYQAFPRFKHGELAYPRLAYATLWLMLTGVASRSVGQPLTEFVSWLWWPAISGAILEVLAIGLFAFILGATWRRAGKPLAFYDYYIVASLIWFITGPKPDSPVSWRALLGRLSRLNRLKVFDTSFAAAGISRVARFSIGLPGPLEKVRCFLATSSRSWPTEKTSPSCTRTRISSR